MKPFHIFICLLLAGGIGWLIWRAVPIREIEVREISEESTQPSDLGFSLPGGATEIEIHQYEIKIQADGELMMDGEVIEMNQLESQVKRLALEAEKASARLFISLSSDGEKSDETISDVLAVLREAGVENVTLVN